VLIRRHPREHTGLDLLLHHGLGRASSVLTRRERKEVGDVVGKLGLGDGEDVE
jgi:hypothetical protein